jgi:hypothetical protein
MALPTGEWVTWAKRAAWVFGFLLAVGIVADGLDDDRLVKDVDVGSAWKYAPLAGLLLGYPVAFLQDEWGRRESGIKRTDSAARICHNLVTALLLGLISLWAISRFLIAISHGSDQVAHQIADDSVVGSIEVEDVYEKLILSGVEMVPLLEIPETVGWTDPVPQPGPLLAGVCLGLKVWIAVVVFSAIKRMYDVVSGTSEG